MPRKSPRKENVGKIRWTEERNSVVGLERTREVELLRIRSGRGSFNIVVGILLLGRFHALQFGLRHEVGLNEADFRRPGVFKRVVTNKQTTHRYDTVDICDEIAAVVAVGSLNNK
jgi:hypothetical protein